MKTTITEEYEDGQLVRRTTVTDGEPATGGFIPAIPGLLPGLYPSARCTCGPWASVTSPPPCPVHGQSYTPTIICSTSATAQEVAEQVGAALRRIA